MLDFPNAPTNGQIFAAPNGVSYTWNARGLWNDAPPMSADWLWPDEHLVFDYDFRNGRYWTRPLGEISAAQAFIATRASNNNLAFDANGLLVQFAANTPRIVPGRGLWIEGSGAGRLDFNDDLSNAAWVKTNITVLQDIPSCFATGTPLGWRITATAANATILQTSAIVPPAAGAGGDQLINSALFYLPVGTTLAGAVEMTQDGTTWTDVTSQLVAGRWAYAYGSIQPNSGAPQPVGIRLTASGDSLGAMLPNIDRGYFLMSPVRVPSNTATSRGAEQCLVNMSMLPPMGNAALPRFTILVVVEPMLWPLPPVLDPDFPRLGWTALEFNDDDTITFEGRGSITNDVMTVTQADAGAVVTGHRLLVGSGALSFTDIISNGTGTGGLGTYNVHSSLSDTPAYPPTQTTPADIVLKARLKDAQGYGHNSAVKPENGDQQIGVTFSNELAGMYVGLDPQIATFQYNTHNAMGWSIDTLESPSPKAHISLKGDVYTSTDVQLFASPQLGPGCYIMIGSQGGATSPFGPLRGVVRRAFCVARNYNPAEMSAATTSLQATGG